MKRKIGTIYNKPIVEGDTNLITFDEIHVKELMGGGDVIKEWYYLIDVEKMIADLNITDDNTKMKYLAMIIMFSPIAYILSSAYDARPINTEYYSSTIELPSVYNFERLRGIRISDCIGCELVGGGSSDYRTRRCFGDIKKKK